MRCETCNNETGSHLVRFCSAECEQDFWDAMGYPNDDEIFDVPHHQTEPIPEDVNTMLPEEEPPYLDDYYKPYSQSVSDYELDELRRSK